MSRPRRPWRRCGSCNGIAHWADTSWVCDTCEDEWDSDHDPKYAAPGDTLNRTPRTENPMLIETLGDIASNAVSRAQAHAVEAIASADAVAKVYGQAKLDDRPRLLALTQAADMAALHARTAAARAEHVHAQPFRDSHVQTLKDFAEDTLRHSRDALNTLAAATH